MKKNSYGIHFDSPIFFDLETSGLDWNKHEIIQIAAIHPESGDSFELKIQFDLSKASKEALEINHYSPDEWKDAVSQEEACQQFAKFLRNHRSVEKLSKKGGIYKVAMLAGYNCNGFDRFFILEWFKKFNTFMPADYRMYDAYPLSMFLLPNMENYKLMDVAKELELNIDNAHDATADTQMTIDVCACLLEMLSLAVDMPEWAVKTLEKIDEE